MKKRMIITLLFIIMLSGCAHWEWKREDNVKVTYSNFIRDHQQCQFSESILMIVIGGLGHEYYKCMEEKGYKRW